MEFVEVMRQWKRRFEAEKILTDSETSGLDALWLAMDNPEEIESMVMSWAAENPEPQFPTWYEYLTDMYPATWNMIKDKPIPADIAEKLGIAPKEG